PSDRFTLQDPGNPGVPYDFDVPRLSGKYGAAFAAAIRYYAGIVLNGAIFLPALNFILLIVFVRDVGRFFGEEIDITNVTRLI
ncbi:MAG: hypothetical protein NT157_05330, partial [Candidatus Micrarchaeota archaeon]|nr:hypothetical protein [Candidatus Micrarchaeota archaeon]